MQKAFIPNSIQDPILLTILASRPKVFDDISPADELERQNRMIGMLKSSKIYRKLAADNANQKWQSSLLDSDSPSDGSTSRGSDQTLNSNHTIKQTEQKRVSFSDKLDFIPADYKIESANHKSFNGIASKLRTLMRISA